MDIKSNTQEQTYICKIISKNLFVEKTGNITVYGINMYNRDEKLAMDENEHCCIEDISEDFKKVYKLRELLVECDVYPIHLKDIVEDFLVMNPTSA